MAQEMSARRFTDAIDPAESRGRREDPLEELARIIRREDPYADYLKSAVRSPAPAVAPDAVKEPMELPRVPLASAPPAAPADWDDLEAELEWFAKSRQSAPAPAPVVARDEPEVAAPSVVADAEEAFEAAEDAPAAPADANVDDEAGIEWADADAAAEEDENDPIWADEETQDAKSAADATSEPMYGDEGQAEHEFEAAIAEAAAGELRGAIEEPAPAESASGPSAAGLAAAGVAGVAAAGVMGAAAWRARISREPQTPQQPDLDASIRQARGPELAADRAALDPVYSPDGHVAPPADAAEMVAPPRRRTRGVTAVVAVLGLAVLGGTGVLAYRMVSGGSAAGDGRVIRANPEPIKQPTQAAAEQKPVTDRVPAGERVVSREERPLSAQDQAAQIQAPPAMPRVIPLSTPQASAEAGEPRAAGEEPRRVRTVPVGPDGQVIGQAPRPTSIPTLPLGAPASGATAQTPPSAIIATPIQPPPAQPQVQPPAVTVAPPPPPRPARVEPPRQQVARAEPSAGATSVRPVAPTRPERNEPLNIAPRVTASTTPATGGGSAFVQISSHQSEAEARSSFASAQRRLSPLQGLSPSIRAADLGARGTWYRVRVGPFSRSEAQSLCERLRASGGSCVVAN